MRCLLVFWALLCLAVAAEADPNDMHGGVLILHAPDFSEAGNWDWCDQYHNTGHPDAPFGIASCDEQVNTAPVTGSSYEHNLLFVVAAWHEPKVWCGVQFGIAPEFDGLWYFIEYGPCHEDCLELSTDGWPGAGEGTAIVGWKLPWEGNFEAVYFFKGYSFEDTRLPLGLDPTHDFAGFGNCDEPAQVVAATCLGAVDISSDGTGTYCCPVPPGEPEACCFTDGHCEMLNNYDCLHSGGEFYGGDCDPVNPCPSPPPVGACCLDTGECFYIAQQDCEMIGGDWFLGEDCDRNPCTTPAERTTWGKIKALYK